MPTTPICLSPRFSTRLSPRTASARLHRLSLVVATGLCLIGLPLTHSTALADEQTEAVKEQPQAAGANNPFAGMPPEAVQALLAMNLDKEQRGAFGAEMRKYSEGMQAAIARIARGRNPDKARAMKRKTKSLTKSMDSAMKDILRDDQWPAYEAYKSAFAQTGN